MATTPNYSWVMPAPTDFVTDLPADFEIFGDAVDASLYALSPGTTAGDVDYYTSSTAKARLGIGTAGQVLAVNSGATAPEWVTPAVPGGLSVITSGSLTGSAINLTSIPQTFQDLRLVLEQPKTTTGAAVIFRVNNLSGADYDFIRQVTTTATVTNSLDQTSLVGRATLTVANSYSAILEIKNYSEDSKHMLHLEFNENNASFLYFGVHDESTTKAITELNIALSAAGDFDGGTYTLYGVN